MKALIRDRTTGSSRSVDVDAGAVLPMSADEEVVYLGTPVEGGLTVSIRLELHPHGVLTWPVTDELPLWHQSSVSVREGSLIETLANAVGSESARGLAALLEAWNRRQRERPDSKGG